MIEAERLTEKLCFTCGLNPRYVSSTGRKASYCSGCNVQRTTKYRLANLEASQQYHKDYFKEYSTRPGFKAKRTEYNATYKAKHSTAIKTKDDAYYDANKEQILQRRREVYAAKKVI